MSSIFLNFFLLHPLRTFPGGTKNAGQQGMQNKKTGLSLKEWDYMSLRAKRSNLIKQIHFFRGIAALRSQGHQEQIATPQELAMTWRIFLHLIPVTLR